MPRPTAPQAREPEPAPAHRTRTVLGAPSASDPDAFLQWAWSTHYQRILRYFLFKWHMPEQDADEQVVETFRRLYSRLLRDPPSPESTGRELLVMARYQALSWWERKGSHEAVPGVEPQAPPNKPVRPDEHFDAAELFDLLLRFLESCNAIDALILEAALDGLSNPTISELVEREHQVRKSPDSIRKTRRRLQERFARFLEERRGGPHVHGPSQER